MSRAFHLTDYILAGLRHKISRNFATVFCFAFIAANIFSAQYLLAGTAESFDTGMTRMGADLLVVPGSSAPLISSSDRSVVTPNSIVRVEPSVIRFDDAPLDTIRKVPGVSALSPQLFVARLAIADQPDPVEVYGIDPVTDFTITPWLTSRLPASLAPGQVITGSAVDGKLSSPILIGDNTYIIAGRLAPTRSGVDHSIFMTLDDAYALAAEPQVIPPSDPPIRKGTINAILVRTEPGSDPAMVGARIQRPYPMRDIRVLEQHFALKSVSGTVRGLPELLGSISLIVILATMPLIAVISAMVAHERQRELGLLMAMGGRRKLIFLIVIAESLLLAIAGGVIGALVSFVIMTLLTTSGLLSATFQQTFAVPGISVTAVDLFWAIAVVVIIGTIASLWPAYRISRMNIYDAIRTTN